MKKSKYSKILTEKLLIKEYSIKENSPYQIADKIGCYPSIVRRYLKKFNIPIRTLSEAIKLLNRKGKNHPAYKRQKSGNKTKPLLQRPRL